MKTVTQLWKELAAAYRELGYNDTSAITSLHPPINASQIKALENTLPGVQWPKEYLELLKIHNGSGQESKSELENFSFVLWRFMSSSEAITQYHRSHVFNKEGGHKGTPNATQGVQPVFWDDKWFPIFYKEDGAMICLDFNPASGGKVGQVIELHKRGSAVKKWNSFLDFFTQTVEEILDDPEFEIFFNPHDEELLNEKEEKAAADKKLATESHGHGDNRPAYSRW